MDSWCRAAVLGSPVAHSLSPVIHRAAYLDLGLTNWEYSAVQIETSELAEFLADKDDSWWGFSVTMPLKETALALADEATKLARVSNAANTLVHKDGKWLADNTDIYGIQAALAPALERPSSAAILGSGATARSAFLALDGLGVDQITIYARNLATAGTLRELAAGLGRKIAIADLSDWGAAPADVVVSTLPGSAQVSNLLPEKRDGVLLDVVYADWPTPLATAALAAGMTVISGLEMLVHQAAKQFELFTRRPAPVAAMLAAGRAALSQTGPGRRRTT